ncbi:MAG: flagellar basal body-associated FliL family protein [Sedimentisphaerales bacterium]|jgi:flagellar basal body-associated protein FliL
MADEKAEPKLQEKPAEAPAENKDNKDKAEKSKSRSFLPFIIIGVIVLVAAGVGIGLGRLLASSSKPASAEEAEKGKEATAEKSAAKPAAEKGEKSKSEKPAGEKSKSESSKSEKNTVKEGEPWYYNLDPVVANLDEPGATRYIRTAFTLEMSPDISAEKGIALLDQKKPLIANLLTIYLAGLNIETTRGDKNLKRIQSELCDTFNEQLFPESKPMVKRILIKEFAVQ